MSLSVEVKRQQSIRVSAFAGLGVAIGDQVLDLWQLVQDCRIDVVEPGVFAASTLNPFMALGPTVWSRTRARISELLRHDHPELRDNPELRQRALVPMADVRLHLPIAVSGYTDFYSSKEHASNVGTMFRDKSNPLLPNWLHIPIGYNGRSSTSWCPAPKCAGRAGN